MMKAWMVTVAVVVLTAGCRVGKLSSLMESWVGKPATDVVIRWGPPNIQTRLDDSTTLLTWEIRRDGEACRRNFAVGADGLIKRWGTTNCPPFVR